jgi:cytochrome c peroxidase
MRVILLLLALSTPFSGAGASLQIQIDPQFAGQPIQPDSLRYQTVAGESFSFTRVSYLLSGFALERGDSSWLELTNQQAWLDLEAGRNTIQLTGVPTNAYRSLRFYVGLDPDLNHAKPEQFPAGHPLNPNLNGLHWSWQGGYIFMALEGMWKNSGNPYDGWAYHLAGDTNRTCINLAVPLELKDVTKLELALDISAVLNVPRPLSFAKDGPSTHSRDNDPVAAAMVANLPGAFRIRRVTTGTPAGASVAKVQPLYLPKTFTPYPFQMSSTFPIPDLPCDNPLIKERVDLGAKLFHDPALSRDGSISCASCHQIKAAFSDTRRYSLGVDNRVGTRQAMPLFNLAWKSSFFWDGRAPSLRAQALFPIQDHAEMDQSLTNLVTKLISLPSSAPKHETRSISLSSLGGEGRGEETTRDYPALFTVAFGSPEITAGKIGLALEQFVLTLTSFDSKFDRAMKGEGELSDEEKHGFELFMTEYDPRLNQFGADCFHCHGGSLFQSQTFANNGLDAECADEGRAKITGKPGDKGKFATPSLRNVALTAPYMHDGRFKTLKEVVDHYSTGVKRSPTLDPNIAKHPDGGLHLSEKDKSALVAFLKTLTDSRFQKTSDEPQASR